MIRNTARNFLKALLVSGFLGVACAPPAPESPSANSGAKASPAQTSPAVTRPPGDIEAHSSAEDTEQTAGAPKPASAEQANNPAMEPAPGSPTASVAEPLELPQGTTILHIGDSFAGALGVALNEQLRAQGLKSHLKFKTASMIPDWSDGHEVLGYMLQYKPDLVLITLGANELLLPDPTQRLRAIGRLLKQVGDAPCVWVAIPLWGLDNGLMEVLRDNIGHCRFMDTNQIYPDMPRLKDKIHPTIPARKIWAEKVVEWLRAEREPSAEQVWRLRSAQPTSAQGD